jgi:hypothetical protein
MDEWRDDGTGWPGLKLAGVADHEQTDCAAIVGVSRIIFLVGELNVQRERGYGNSPMSPNSPMMLPNTSTTSILTKRFGSAASASAAVDPVMPTQTPQRRLHTPTVRPPQKSAKPVKVGWSLPFHREHERGGRGVPVK